MVAADPIPIRRYARPQGGLDARRAGRRTIDVLGMPVDQGVLGMRCWTRVDALAAHKACLEPSKVPAPDGIIADAGRGRRALRFDPTAWTTTRRTARRVLLMGDALHGPCGVSGRRRASSGLH